MMIFPHKSPFDAKEAYVSREASFWLPHPASDTAELIHHACQAVARIFRPGIRYRDCGVMLAELIPETDRQGDLLDTLDAARSKQLMATLDVIDRRMGRDAVCDAAAGVKRDWAIAVTMKSRHFTTD